MATAYALATSVAPGERLMFQVDGSADGPVTATVYDAVDGTPVARSRVEGPRWVLEIPEGWRSSLYRAVFRETSAEDDDASETDPDAEAHFVVRAAAPGAPVLLSVPFATWQAYNRFDVPGEGLYGAENPERAARVSFDRPGGGPPTERWEHGLMAWLRANDIAVDYCSGLDLHGGDDLLAGYRLLVVNGHDEYWTKEMRDAVETFTRRGGNLAVFAANTAWWQIRLEDAGRTIVCHRDAVADPFSATDPERVTVEWSSAPVNRPENAMTGVSFRRGAGCWGPYMPLMREESYTARFADHWVFEGTGLTDGDQFGRGCLGYETDAADIEERDGVPRATGRDGTPASFVVLATADLAHWAHYGQGGAATMGVFESGAGTVFNAGTVNWGAALHDPAVDRITRNVLSRLSEPPDRSRWTVIGPAADIRALTAVDSRLFAALADGALAVRDLCGQNLRWRPVGRAEGVVALAVPREAVTGGPLGIYAATADGELRYTDADPGPDGIYQWSAFGRVPANTSALAAVNGALYATDRDGLLWTAPLARPDGSSGLDAAEWLECGKAGMLVGLTAMNGRLYGLADDGTILTRRPLAHEPWQQLDGDTGPGTGSTALAAGAGRLIAGSCDGVPLRWREAGPGAAR
ncbi:N,N-dimethylformamidase beta subunit family domain-containing protein [Actinospica robiniae]|uniref:N,N-dimethylformamidase beta subunit family domain-containing protein n=1 Tax=Actinospica robiniae TaxID=304901 RepID=UPI000406CF0C|nr:N,N-dimethylformamidase beta subunit family domain-containing protein [Actinospica robiniae]